MQTSTQARSRTYMPAAASTLGTPSSPRRRLCQSSPSGKRCRTTIDDDIPGRA